MMNRRDFTTKSLVELSLLFLKLGLTAFGGPAAHIAIMHDTFVKRRKWLTDEQFLDLIGATNLIPGPNSTEMAIHIGYLRAGWRGLIVSGVCFILPAMAIVLLCSWFYVKYGSIPQIAWLLYGVKPVVIAIILQALVTLGKKAIRGLIPGIIALAIVISYFLGINELALIALGGIIMMLIVNRNRLLNAYGAHCLIPLAYIPLATVSERVSAFSPALLFFNFLKIGSVLYGSGYVLLAFLRADFVVRLGWLTDKQLLDAISIGQVTPGPVFTTATFIGYILGGFPSALLATAAIFIPSFVFVAISNPLIPKIRRSPWIGSFLDGVNIGSLGLMAGVAWQLGKATLIDPFTVILSVTSLALLIRFRINSAWLIGGGALLGWIWSMLR
jgi:chromate transporter